MKARILKLNPLEVNPSAIAEVCRVIARDGVIVYLTDTLYGIGADCYSEKALLRILEVKRRATGKGMPVLISDVETVNELSAEIPAVFRELAAEFWPGPLTLILKATARLPAELVGPGRTIGVRLPNVPWIRKLVRSARVPLVATSANVSGEREVSTAEEAIRLFGREVDLIVDVDGTPASLPSTVVDLTSEKPLLVREGAISRAGLRKFVRVP